MHSISTGYADDMVPASQEAENATHATASAIDTHTDVGLWSSGFLALVITQFLVALNDNMFRWLIVPIGKDLIGTDNALAIGGAAFLMPFVLLAGPAGYLADRFSKRHVMIGCKVAEIVIMALGILAILSGNVPFMMGVLFMMGAQSALFSPSKYGSIPEMVHSDQISAANGLIGMTTMVACIMGMAAGGFLYTWTTVFVDGKAVDPGTHQWWYNAYALLGVAISGWVVSLSIGRLKPANPTRPFPVNPFAQTFRDLVFLFARRPLLLAALGSAFFWSMGLLVQTDVDKLAREELLVEQKYVGFLLGLVALGIGIGAFLAGIWSAGKVQLGIVPIGAAGMVVTAFVLFLLPPGEEGIVSSSYYWTGGWLLLLGIAAGLFDIPLIAYLQEKCPPDSLGKTLAAYNFISFSGMLVTSGIFFLMVSDKVLGFSASHVFLCISLLMIPVLGLTIWLVPAATARVICKPLSRLFYRIRVEGLENLPTEGGALIIPNHVSWIDGVLLALYCPRPIRMVAYADYLKRWPLNRMAEEEHTIPIKPGRRTIVESIRNARQALRDGDLVCIFPEGGLTRSGQMMPFQPGFLSILKETGAPVIPVYLGGLWGSIFSFERGKFFWKWPLKIPYPVSIRFGTPILEVSESRPVRLAVQQLGGESMQNGDESFLIPARRFLRMCRRNRRRKKLADSSGVELTGAALLTRSLVLRRILRREVLADDEKNVGVLLPPTVAAIVTNAALAIDRRVTLNLNYTVSADVMNQCMAQAGIRHVLTSRKVMEKFKFELDAELVYLEDFKDKATLADKAAATAATWTLPLGSLERRLGLLDVDPDELLSLIFTSGSTGHPKGVMLSHRNIGTNIDGLNQVLHLDRNDVLVGILPMFHSLGYTATLWTVLALDPKGVYHFSPLEARQIGKLCRRHEGTILMATPTFLRSFIRRCEPEDFSSLEVVFTGAEKLPTEVADSFEKRFGVRPYEGYGTTELSPIVSLNVPSARVCDETHPSAKDLTVGQPIPGVTAKVVDLDTGEDLGTDQPGMLLIKGPNVMLGYLDRPDLTDEVVRDGWYVTGDVAFLDADGFIHITGRQSRFSKIGGEMVPHIRIEELLEEILELGSEEITLAVTAIPDARKGERLIVLHTGLSKTPDELCRDLSAAGLPPLYVPSPNSFHQVDNIPILGTGKLDLKGIKDLALKKSGQV